MSLYEFVDELGRVIRSGRLRAVGGTVGDVPTQQADQSLSQSPGGGSQSLAAVVRGPFPVAFDDSDLALQSLPITAVNQAFHSFAITAADPGTSKLTFAGNHVATFLAVGTFTVTGSTGNDGTYTVASATFGTATEVVVNEGVADATADGTAHVPDGTQSFTVAGNRTTLFRAGDNLTVTGSTGNDGTYTVVSSVFGVATVITVQEVIFDGTVDGSAHNVSTVGAVFYTPAEGEFLLNAWVELQQQWNGTTPKLDFGSFHDGATEGYLAVAGHPRALSAAISQPPPNTFGLVCQESGGSSSGDIEYLGGGQISPGRFTGQLPLCVCVTTTGAPTGNSPGASQGSADIYLVTAIP